MTVSLLIGDALTVLRTLPAGSVQCCVTSPPYYALRSYLPDGHPDKALEIGSEATPEQFIARLVGVFAEVRRVLRDDGVCFINIGDSYVSNGRYDAAYEAKKERGGIHANDAKKYPSVNIRAAAKAAGIKTKDLIGIPWMLAFALRADGWYLRSEIIWAKRNCMPESVKDRPTRAHEQVFLLTKRANYFYDAVAIEEDGDIPAGTRAAKGSGSRGTEKHVNGRPPEYWEYTGRRNKRTVWTMATKPFPQAHFATFPPELPETCIKAGTSERGCCPACGAPWERHIERETVRAHGGTREMTKTPLNVVRAGWRNGGPVSATIGWAPTCSCPAAEPRPCVVLDPFAGAGTTGLVADRLRRDAVLIDLSGAYGQMQEDRLTADAPLLTTVTRRPAPNQQDALT